MQYLIIGSGIAGISAAEQIREREPNAAMTLVTDEVHKFYSRPGLAYLLSGNIPEKQLTARTDAEIRALRVDWIHARVTQLDLSAHRVVLENGKILNYDRALVATGVCAIPPGFPGSDAHGVVKIDNLDDARRILKLAQRGRTAVVVGGGITALELAEALHGRGLRVHYFLRGARYWANVLDETESQLIQKRLEDDGITLHFHTQVKQVISKNKQLVAVETQNGERIPCQLLATALGVRPRLELAKNAGLKTDRGIFVNEYLQTSAPDVFAAGDVAQVFDPNSDSAVLDTLWSTALAQGRVAGANMTGAQIPYQKKVALNVTQLGGVITTIVGTVGARHDDDLITIARGDSESWRTHNEGWTVIEPEDIASNHVRVVFGARHIVGAVIMGDQTLSRPLYELILHKVDVTALREKLLAHPTLLVSLIQDFFAQWKANNATPD